MTTSVVLIVSCIAVGKSYNFRCNVYILVDIEDSLSEASSKLSSIADQPRMLRISSMLCGIVSVISSNLKLCFDIGAWD